MSSYPGNSIWRHARDWFQHNKTSRARPSRETHQHCSCPPILILSSLDPGNIKVRIAMSFSLVGNCRCNLVRSKLWISHAGASTLVRTYIISVELFIHDKPAVSWIVVKPFSITFVWDAPVQYQNLGFHQNSVPHHSFFRMKAMHLSVYS